MVGTRHVDLGDRADWRVLQRVSASSVTGHANQMYGAHSGGSPAVSNRARYPPLTTDVSLVSPYGTT